MFVASIAECTSRLTYVTAAHQRKHGACVAEVEGCGSGYTVNVGYNDYTCPHVDGP